VLFKEALERFTQRTGKDTIFWQNYYSTSVSLFTLCIFLEYYI
jgi:hypothetical protein